MGFLVWASITLEKMSKQTEVINLRSQDKYGMRCSNQQMVDTLLRT